MASFAMSFYRAEVFIPNVEHVADAGDASDHDTSIQPAPSVSSAPSRPSVVMAPAARPAQPTISRSQPSAHTMDSARESAIESRPTAVLPSTEIIGRPPASLPDRTAAVVARKECGIAWSDWIDIGKDVGNPCPAGCERENELGKSIRMVGFPPRPQEKHKFQCLK